MHLANAMHQIQVTSVIPVSMSPVHTAMTLTPPMTDASISFTEPVIKHMDGIIDGSFAKQPESDGTPLQENGNGEDTEMWEHEDEDEDENPNEFRYERSGDFIPLPSIAEAEIGLEAIKLILKPPQKKGPGSEDHGLDKLTFYIPFK